ncbi:uncharacterized protein LOC123219409 [Mangifera indica]|uniref:uncharacterized protein LOC123219409 n=1 Tax=Mangifera indica TaxID=29780 RepID=UPI001CFC406B|nr:uncharacterized protein LOC123219409 [Mangifera indica]
MVYSSSRTVSVIISLHLPLITIMIIKSTVARELRPSDHGLEYQSAPPPAAKTKPEMRLFFKGSSSPSTSNSSNSVALPRAMNSNDTSWWNANVAGGGSGGRDHVRHVMLVASLVCGVTGLALLIASAFIYIFKHQSRKSSSPSSCVDNNNNNRK